ncbi:MAG: RloF [Candidatus Ozemobacter sibiricus]|jgi:hypothetical protein|uniref:RloF n=1 Tax=Candidatus Ozemobacter sibiricus TaxID=2268124 RepID=A0A367ZRD8_9BACT|nr:MAG: RloF [Candidatus Ozemobacter sibiricus]
MPSTNVLHTVTADFGSLIGNGRIYRVPPFQRDYSWTDEQWEDLWSDIKGLEEEKLHYMGYAVFQTEDDRNFTIIDGQQRFTTLSILALAVMQAIRELAEKGIEPKENQERVEELRRQFIGYKDPAALTTSSRLVLNRNNDDFYQSYLLRMRKPASTARLKPSERLMWEAFEYFGRMLAKDFPQATGSDLARFLNETIARQLIFTTMYVRDGLQAYKVFETLNARGVRLSAADLLKNYLFSIVDKERRADLPEAERQWQSINNSLGAEDFTVFLRHYWNSGHLLERQPTLFKAIQGEVKTADHVFALLEDLEKFAPLYAALQRPDDPQWTKEQKRSVLELDLFGVSQCYPLLFSAWRIMDPPAFARLLRICVVISFRYTVISNLACNEMERIYSRVAVEVNTGQRKTPAEIFRGLSTIYVEDRVFESNFSYKTIKTNGRRWKRLARYILFEIENRLNGTALDFDDPATTIEHILPENPGPEWEQAFPALDAEQDGYRLGNLTLLEETKNREVGNSSYTQKRAVYLTSAFKMTRETAAYDEWTPSTLQKRQERLAKIASQVWRIDV